MDSHYETRTETDPEMGEVIARRRQRSATRVGGYCMVSRRLLAELVALDLPASSIALVLETLRQFRMNKKPFRVSTKARQALGIESRGQKRWALSRLPGCGLVTVKTGNGRATELAVTNRLLQLAGLEGKKDGP